MSVCLHGTTLFPLDGFSWNLIFEDFLSVEKIQISLKSDKNNGFVTWRPMCVYDGSMILLTMRNVSDNNCRGNTNFMFKNFSRKSCLLWDNVENYGTAWQVKDDIIWRMHCTYCVTKTTDINSENVILIPFRQQQLSKGRASILHYKIHCLSYLLSSAES